MGKLLKSLVVKVEVWNVCAASVTGAIVAGAGVCNLYNDGS